MSQEKDQKKKSAGKRLRHWLLRSWLVHVPTRVFVWVLGRLPLGLARVLGRVGGWLAYYLNGRARKVARTNLELVFPDRSPSEHRAILKASFVHLGICLVEFCRLTRLTAEDVRERWILEEDGSFEKLREAVNSGKGAIIHGGHVGSWELGGTALPAFGLPLHGIARRVESEPIDALIMRTRSHLGTKVVYQDHGLFHMYRALRKGKLVGLVVDQYAGREGVYVPFFGRDASSVDTTARLHVMTGAPLFCGAMLRREDGRYVWRLLPVEVPAAKEGQAEDERIREVLCCCQRGIEELIRMAPEQWLWGHNRWRDHRR